MTSLTFDSPFWNLAQAALWVRFRIPSLVDRFVYAERDAYVAIGFYPCKKTGTDKEVSSVLELEKALETGKVKARGYHKDRADKPEDIPPEQWTYLSLRPPFAFDQRYLGAQVEIWKNITVRSRELRKLWRGIGETKSRTKYDWEETRGC